MIHKEAREEEIAVVLGATVSEAQLVADRWPEPESPGHAGCARSRGLALSQGAPGRRDRRGAGNHVARRWQPRAALQMVTKEEHQGEK